MVHTTFNSKASLCKYPLHLCSKARRVNNSAMESGYRVNVNSTILSVVFVSVVINR